jgi:hypothetical protein
MTPDEIRAQTETSYDASAELNQSAAFRMLREIAAQLAEQNQQARDDRLQRKVWHDEDQAQTKARDEVMESLANTTKGGLAQLPPPPDVRADFFPSTVTHLACIIREPDGAYKIATNTGDLIELDGTTFARLIVLLTKGEISEARPS